jgi:hypothetical protein
MPPGERRLRPVTRSGGGTQHGWSPRGCGRSELHNTPCFAGAQVVDCADPPATALPPGGAQLPRTSYGMVPGAPGPSSGGCAGRCPRQLAGRLVRRVLAPGRRPCGTLVQVAAQVLDPPCSRCSSESRRGWTSATNWSTRGRTSSMAPCAFGRMSAMASSTRVSSSSRALRILGRASSIAASSRACSSFNWSLRPGSCPPPPCRSGSAWCLLWCVFRRRSAAPRPSLRARRVHVSTGAGSAGRARSAAAAGGAGPGTPGTSGGRGPWASGA